VRPEPSLLEQIFEAMSDVKAELHYRVMATEITFSPMPRLGTFATRIKARLKLGLSTSWRYASKFLI
jgi:hypothetical protein